MMAKELLILTGLFYFAGTLPESNTMAISSSSRDFDLSASNVAYDRSRGKDTEIATTPALKDTRNTAITPLQATKQLTTTIVTQNSNDNEFVLTAVGSQPFFSLSTCLPSRTRTTTMTTQVQAGNLLSNSSSSFFHRALFTKNGHKIAVSSTFPSSGIYSGPEITLATSRLSGVITANTFTKAKMNAATNTKTRDAFDTVSREPFPISISFNSMGKKIASSSQLQTAQLSSPSILVEISVFEHDTSISTPDGNKMFTKGSGRCTNSPSNVLVGSTIWDGLNLTPNATSYSNVALSRMSKTAISSKNTSSVGEVSQASIESSFPDISGISQTGMKGAEMTHLLDTEFYSSRTLYTTSSFVVAGTSPQTSPNSSFNPGQFSALSTGKTRAFYTLMASPEVASKTQTFSSRTTEAISTALMSASGSDTLKKDSSIKVTSELDTVMKSSALEAKRLSSRVNTTSYLRSNLATSAKGSLTTSGKVSSIPKGNSTTEMTSVPGSSFVSLWLVTDKSLTAQEALVPSETTNHFPTATRSLSRSSETYFMSTQRSDAYPQISAVKSRSIVWPSTSSRFVSEISPSISIAHFSSPVSQIVTGTESQTNQHQETMHLKSSKIKSSGQPLFILSSKIKSFSVRPPSIDISSTRVDPGIRLSSSQGSTATEHPLTSSYSQVKSHWKVSSLDNKTRLQSQLPPSVTIPMVTSTLDSGKLNVSSSAPVVPRRTQVTSKVNVIPPGLTSHKPPTIQVQPTPSTTSSATVAGNISTENPPTTVSDSNTGHVKLLVVVAIVPSVILCVLFAAVLWFRRHRRQQKFPSYSIKVEYLDEKKFRKRCVNSRLDLSLKGIHIDLEFPSERRDSYPRDIALFSRGSNVCERDRESPETEDELEWSNEVIVRVTETSLNSRTQPAGRDSVYSVKEKENFESSEKVVRRESSKRGRETVKWRIPVVQRRDSEEFDQRYSLGTDVTALFLEEPQEEQQSDNSTSKDSPKITQLLCDQSEHDKGDDTSRLDVKDLQVQLPNKKLDDDNQAKENKKTDFKDTELASQSNSRKEESSQHVQNTSPPRPRFGTL